VPNRKRDGMSDEADKPEGKRRGQWLTWPIIMLAVLLLYVVALGPVCWLQQRDVLHPGPFWDALNAGCHG